MVDPSPTQQIPDPTETATKAATEAETKAATETQRGHSTKN